MLSGCLGYFARFDATRAYTHLHTLSILHDSNWLEIGQETSLHTVVRIAHAISRSGPFITYVAEVRHFAVVIS